MKRLSSILSSCAGNILEWYDFGLFAIFSSLFAQEFFPSSDPKTGLLAALGIFAVGFICRPIGALIFGYLGDRQGRAKTLRFSILMISLPTLLIGCIPTYEQIGIWAPIFLVLTRIWQGISLGGEYSGNLIYLAETAPTHLRATITSFAAIGANIGILLASLVGIVVTTLFSQQLLAEWGWRIPYLLSGLFCILLYMFRLRLDETAIFEHLKRKKQLASNPIEIALTKNYLQILRTFGLVCLGSTFYYFCFIYIPIFLKQKDYYSLQAISFTISFLMITMILLIPFAGYLCDRIGRRKLLLFNAAIVAITAIPGMYLLQIPSFSIVFLILCFFTFASILEQGTTCVAVVENFPTPARYTGLSLGYNLGNGLLGGTVPLISEWLTTHISPIAPAFYIALCAAVTGMVVYFFVPETRGKPL